MPLRPVYGLILSASLAASLYAVPGWTQVLTLKDALKRAAYSARSVQQSQATVEGASAQAARSYDNFYPNLSLRGLHDLVKYNNAAHDQIYLNLDVSVFNQGKEFLKVKSAKLDEDQSVLAREQSKLASQVGVIDLYMLGSLAGMQVKVYERELNLLKSLQKRIHALVDRRAASWRQRLKIDREVLIIGQRLSDSIQIGQDVRSRLKLALALDQDASLELPTLPEPKIDDVWLNDSVVKQEQAIRNSKGLSILQLQREQSDVRRSQAYSDFLPRVYLNAKFGKPDFTDLSRQTTRTELSVGVEIPLPVFRAPLLLSPIDRVYASEQKRVDLERVEVAEDLKNEIKTRMSRISQARLQLANVGMLRKITDRERAEEEKSFLIGSLDGSSFLVMLQQTRDIELAIMNYRRVLATDYAVVRLLTGSSVEFNP